MKLTFLGAAGEVTGSQHLIETNNLRVLLDCGMFQGHRAKSRAKNEQFACDPENVDAVILSHAHIDHSGLLPRLYRKGFRGTVFCTSATADIVQIMLRDSAKIQKEDAKYLTRKLKKGHPPVEPLYEQEDVDGLMKLFQPLDYDEWHNLANDFKLRFSDAGHILGSAISEMDIKENGEWKRVVFSGDLGRRDVPILRDPTPIERCDVLICESTYGNRTHPAVKDISDDLLRIITEAEAVGGRVIIPAFSLGRTQLVVHLLNNLFNEKKLPLLPIYVDSPLSTKLTSVYRDHLHFMDDGIQKVMEDGDADPFGFRRLTYTASSRESKELNRKKGAYVVIASSGMCENGRVVHHLKHSVEKVENTVAIIGYQAQHTTGRRIVERQPKIKIFDRMFDLNCHVETLNGLSAHADATDLEWWFGEAAKNGGIGKAFLVHGEEESANAMAKLVRDHCDEDPIVPQWGDSFEV